MLLTGTPIRNAAKEADQLLRTAAPSAYERISRLAPARRSASGPEKQVALGLSGLMIRRLKSQVLDSLPPVVRSPLDLEMTQEAVGEYKAAVAAGIDQVRAIMEAEGADASSLQLATAKPLAKLRRIVGIAKACHPDIHALVDDVMEAEGALLVFAHHRDAIAELASRFEDRGYSVVTCTGQHSADEKTAAAEAFQNDEADIFVGSIIAAGEALTLTRAATVLEVEYTWVPTEMLQAEARGLRPGQTAQRYHVIQATAHGFDDIEVDVDGVMRDALTRKVAVIERVLKEKTDVLAGTDGDIDARAVAANQLIEAARRQKENENEDQAALA